ATKREASRADADARTGVQTMAETGPNSAANRGVSCSLAAPAGRSRSDVVRVPDHDAKPALHLRQTAASVYCYYYEILIFQPARGKAPVPILQVIGCSPPPCRFRFWR